MKNTNINTLQAIANRLKNLEDRISSDKNLSSQLKDLFNVYISIANDMLQRLYQLLQVLDILEIALSELKEQIAKQQEEYKISARKSLTAKLKTGGANTNTVIIAASVLRRYADLFEQYEKLRRVYVDTQSKILDILSNIQKYYEQKESLLLKHELRLKLEQLKKESSEIAVKQETIRAVLNKLEKDGTLSNLRNKFLQSQEINKSDLVDQEYKRNFLSDVENLERLKEEIDEE